MCRGIVLTRPAVEAGERLGFLPGDLAAKIDPYLKPLYDALYEMLEPETFTRYVEQGRIEIAPACLHARQNSERRLHHPGRGTEHHTRANEDVSHAAAALVPKRWLRATLLRSICLRTHARG